MDRGNFSTLCNRPSCPHIYPYIVHKFTHRRYPMVDIPKHINLLHLLPWSHSSNNHIGKGIWKPYVGIQNQHISWHIELPSLYYRSTTSASEFLITRLFYHIRQNIINTLGPLGIFCASLNVLYLTIAYGWPHYIYLHSVQLVWFLIYSYIY